MLDKSRTVVDRVYTLGLHYRLDREQKWMDRAAGEMLAVAAFKDWNRPTKGLGKLLIRLPQQQGALRIAVLLEPGADRGGEVKLAPLEAWGTLRH